MYSHLCRSGVLDGRTVEKAHGFTVIGPTTLRRVLIGCVAFSLGVGSGWVTADSIWPPLTIWPVLVTSAFLAGAIAIWSP